MRMWKNFVQGCDMLMQRVFEGQYFIEPYLDNGKNRRWMIKHSFIGLKNNIVSFKSVNDAHDFVTDELGAHFNVTRDPLV